jgi:hypothetical protein
MALSGTRAESSGLREFLNSPKGKGLAIGGAVMLIIVAGVFIWRAIGPSEAQSLARDRMFIDAKTGKEFKHELSAGEMIPVDAPSGGKTGYPAEACYWTKDGKTKTQPTWVLLKEAVEHKPVPTFCPDCGRLVMGHNPLPKPGGKPPPTEEEYKARPTPPER